MKQQNLKQGEQDWHAHRATARNASDASVVMGCHPNRTRDEWLHERFTGITKEHSQFVKDKVFARGHAIEAKLRAVAEAIIDDDLYPVVGTETVSGIELSASFDGLTLSNKANWECKSLNVELRAALPMPGPDGNDAANLPKYHRIQMQQESMVSGCERVLFTASNGEGDDRHCWFYPDAELGRDIIAAWKQADIDLTAYVPSTTTEMPKAAVTLALPALFIHAKGEITTSNMPEYGKALAARLESVRNIALVTDQDFSDAKEAAKLLRENIESAKQAKDAMLAQTVTVGEAARMIDAWCEDMRLTALQLEKDVAREDMAKKTTMILAAKAAYADHVSKLEIEIAPHRIFVDTPVFAAAIKGKSNFASMQNGLNTALANGKIHVDAAAALIKANLVYFEQHAEGHYTLFADKADLMQRPLDFVTVVIETRIAKHQAAELAKEEATRQRIRAEEQVKAESAARLVVAQEMKAAAPACETIAISAPALVTIAEPAIQTIAPSANVVPMRTTMSAPAAQTPPTLKLGQIGERLGFSLTGDFLKNLGFEPAARDKNAVLFHEADFPLMCMRLVAHIQGVQERQAA